MSTSAALAATTGIAVAVAATTTGVVAAAAAAATTTGVVAAAVAVATTTAMSVRISNEVFMDRTLTFFLLRLLEYILAPRDWFSYP